MISLHLGPRRAVGDSATGTAQRVRNGAGPTPATVRPLRPSGPEKLHKKTIWSWRLSQNLVLSWSGVFFFATPALKPSANSPVTVTPRCDVVRAVGQKVYLDPPHLHQSVSNHLVRRYPDRDPSGLRDFPTSWERICSVWPPQAHCAPSEIGPQNRRWPVTALFGIAILPARPAPKIASRHPEAAQRLARWGSRWAPTHRPPAFQDAHPTSLDSPRPQTSVPSDQRRESRPSHIRLSQ